MGDVTFCLNIFTSYFLFYANILFFFFFEEKHIPMSKVNASYERKLFVAFQKRFSSEMKSRNTHIRTRREFQIFAHARVRGCVKISRDLFCPRQNDICFSSLPMSVLLRVTVAELMRFKNIYAQIKTELECSKIQIINFFNL